MPTRRTSTHARGHTYVETNKPLPHKQLYTRTHTDLHKQNTYYILTERRTTIRWCQWPYYDHRPKPEQAHTLIYEHVQTQIHP